MFDFRIGPKGLASWGLFSYSLKNLKQLITFQSQLGLYIPAGLDTSPHLKSAVLSMVSLVTNLIRYTPIMSGLTLFSYQ